MIPKTPPRDPPRSKAPPPLPPADISRSAATSSENPRLNHAASAGSAEEYVQFDVDNPQMKHTMQTTEEWVAAKQEQEPWDPWRRSTWDEELTPSAHPIASPAASPTQPLAAASSTQGHRQPSWPPPDPPPPPRPPAASSMQPNEALPADKTDDASPNAVAEFSGVQRGEWQATKSKRQLQREQGRSRPISKRTQWHKDWEYYKYKERLSEGDIQRLIGPRPERQLQSQPKARDAAPSNLYSVAK